MDDATTEIPPDVYEQPADEVPEETLQAIEEERQHRLDTTHGRFTDTDVEEELGPFADPE